MKERNKFVKIVDLRGEHDSSRAGFLMEDQRTRDMLEALGKKVTGVGK